MPYCWKCHWKYISYHPRLPANVFFCDPGAWDRRAGTRRGTLLQTDLPLPISRDYDQMDPGHAQPRPRGLTDPPPPLGRDTKQWCSRQAGWLGEDTLLSRRDFVLQRLPKGRRTLIEAPWETSIAVLHSWLSTFMKPPHYWESRSTGDWMYSSWMSILDDLDIFSMEDTINQIKLC